MARVISIANQKGGVGKSTLCIQCAFYLANKNKRVLVIDMDAQGNTSSRLAPKTMTENGNQYLSGTKTVTLFQDDVSNIEVMKCQPGIDLIHSPKNDADLFEIEAIPLEKALNPRKHLMPLMDKYDYVLIDCPPSLGRKLVAALAMSTHVACPVRLSGFAIDGVEGLLNTIIGIKQAFNPDLDIVGLIINDMDRSVKTDESYQALVDALPNLVFKHRIMHRPPLDSATSDGIPVWDLRYGHVAAREVKAVLDELISKVN